MNETKLRREVDDNSSPAAPDAPVTSEDPSLPPVLGEGGDDNNNGSESAKLSNNDKNDIQEKEVEVDGKDSTDADVRLSPRDPPKGGANDQEKNLDRHKSATPTADLANETIPLLYYTRVQSPGVPRPAPSNDGETTTTTTTTLPFQTPCTCSVMGRILLTSENVVGPSTTTHSSGNGGDGTNTEDETTPVLTLLQQYLPHLVSAGPDVPIELFVAVLGFRDGTVAVLDARTQANLSAPQQFQMRESGTRQAIVALSMDSTGTFLAAVDAGGMCTIFEMNKFQIAMRAPTMDASSPTATTTEGNVFSSLMSAFTGGNNKATPITQTAAAASSSEGSVANNTPRQPTLVISSLLTHRIPYPRNFGTPTSIAIDPAYKRRREKAVLVGFADGRLVQTKRGIIFQRRNDTVVHQALPLAPTDATMAPGIQSLAWRGNLVAWAEPSGIRLFDAEGMTKIAHVDRPVGARPSLYPSVRDTTARLCFETSERLLVVWGDCLLQLTIRETNTTTSSSGAGTNHAAHTPEGTPAVVRRRTVECTMAWELDCIAAGVAPLDKDHVLVLGLVPNMDDDENAKNTGFSNQNEVELQVLSRSNGNVVYSDLLPLLKARPETTRQRRGKNQSEESIAPFSLLSTSKTPRMADNAEQIQSGEFGSDFDPVALFSSGMAPRQKFRDSHLLWDLSHVSPGDTAPQDTSVDDGESNDDQDSVGSVDSDDYSFIQRPLVMGTEFSRFAPPPTLWVVSGSDAVTGRVRNLDDAIAAVQDRPAIALQRALRHRTQLRTHKLNDLVNAYLAAVLRISSRGQTRLSLRRMKLAASAMPVLLGGNAELWQHWVSQLVDLPGALFILRNVMPVRDPILPHECYTTVLKKMFEQILEMKVSSEPKKILDIERLVGEAENHFLFTLLGWGTSLGIREHLQHYKYLSGLYPSYKAVLIATEEVARRREKQSSTSYLCFPAENLESALDPSGLEYLPPDEADELRDSLYDVDALTLYFEASLENNWIKMEERGGRVALDSLAKLKIGKGQYHAALKYLLLLGSRYGSLSLDELEGSAVQTVENEMKASHSSKKFPYAFVLSLIETKHLHQILLDKSLLAGEGAVPPIIALMQLVGVDLAAEFFTENCVSVQSEKRIKSQQLNDFKSTERRGTLPLDAVADQLEASPKILYWYLHCIFLWKPEIYVNFPNTYHPPEAVTRLHRKALDLYIKYAGDKRDSVNVLRGIEAYRVTEITTPLLSFLKTVLQLGGINPTEVAKQLQVQRKGGAGISGVFALELAYILDRYGVQSKENVNVVLELYLKGAHSLMLAVSFAQRSKEHKVELWHTLIQYCLSNDKRKAEGDQVDDGKLFGSLLEAAALSGADLASLVTKIPQGMSIEGLRPRLVGAVSDYRWKLRMHESANEITGKEMVDLYKEYEHRSRRGKRYELSDKVEVPGWVKLANGNDSSEPKNGKTPEQSVLAPTLRPKERPQRFHLSYFLPMR